MPALQAAGVRTAEASIRRLESRWRYALIAAFAEVAAGASPDAESWCPSRGSRPEQVEAMAASSAAVPRYFGIYLTMRAK